MSLTSRQFGAHLVSHFPSGLFLCSPNLKPKTSPNFANWFNVSLPVSGVESAGSIHSVTLTLWGTSLRALGWQPSRVLTLGSDLWAPFAGNLQLLCGAGGYGVSWRY